MKFTELRLAEPIVRAIASEGYTTPTPIQTKAIPVIIDGKDMFGCAQTGTGKTGAFALPLLHNLASNPRRHNAVSNGAVSNGAVSNRNNGGPGSGSRGGQGGQGGQRRSSGRPPRALILAPTRELASQILESVSSYGRHLPLRHTVIFGGVNQSRQVRAMREGVDILVATPGRLLDLMNQGMVDLSCIEALILDEADRMLDMGFIHDIRKIVARMPEDRQTLLFSATMPDEIRSLADSILKNPEMVQTAPVATSAEAITQSVYMVARKDKPVLLERLLKGEGVGRTLIFTRTKFGADKLAKVLNQVGIRADAIHGNKTQNARTRALQMFKSRSRSVLVATDIASRGIDVDEITHVVNFDLPDTPETYVHRIGRTARAGASGAAISFCDHDQRNELRAIRRIVGKKLELMDNDPDIAEAAPKPLVDRGDRKGPSKASHGGPGGPGGSGSQGSRGFGGKPGHRGKPANGKPQARRGRFKPGSGARPAAAMSSTGGQDSGAPGASGGQHGNKGSGPQARSPRNRRTRED